jgi:hypothetical protein
MPKQEQRSRKVSLFKRSRAVKKPCYDTDLRELRVSKVLVKCLTQASDAQEVILAAFEEENWPHCIDDPLTGKGEQERKQRLRTAVANLNRRQRVPLLHFLVRRQGSAVAWEFRGQRQ